MFLISIYLNFLLLQEDFSTYRVNVDLPEYNGEDDSEDGVIVPETANLLDEATSLFLDRISAVEQANPWDTAPYLHALQTLNSLLGN